MNPRDAATSDPGREGSTRPEDEARPANAGHLLRLIEGVDAVLWEADARTWAFTFIGSNIERLLGYPVARFLGAAGAEFFASLIHPGDRDAATAVCDRAIAKRESYEVTYRARTADGRWLWVRDVARIETDAAGKAVRVYGLLIDVTAQRRAESRLRDRETRLEALLHNTNDTVLVYHLDDSGEPGPFIEVNAAAIELYGYTREELLSMRVRDLVDPSPHVDEALQTLERERRVVVESVHVTKDGRRIPMEVSAQRFVFEGRPTIVSSCRDISRRRAAENAVRQRDHRLAETLDHLGEMFIEIGFDWRVTFMNARAAEWTGRPQYELIGADFWATYPMFEGTPLDAKLRHAMEHREAVQLEMVVPRSGRWFELRIYPCDAGVSLFALDVDERKRAQDAVRRSEERLRVALHAAQAGYWIYDTATQASAWSDEVWDAFGLDKEAGVPTDALWRSIIHPDDLESCREQWMRCMDAGELDMEYRVLHPQRGERRIASIGRVVERRDDGSVLMTGITIDITERAKLREELAIHSRVLASMTEGVSVADDTGVIVYTNEAEDRMFGYARGELLGRHLSVQNAYDPQESARRIAEIMAYVRRHGSWAGEWHNRRKDGTGFFTFAQITEIDLGGKPHFVCVQHDITEWKRVSERLHESERRFRGFVENTSDVLWMTDSTGQKLVYISPSFQSLWGRRPQAVLDDLSKFLDYIHPDDRERVIREQQRNHTAPGVAEYRIVRPDGEVRWVRERAFPVRDDAGVLRYIAGIAEDVTEQKQSEQALRELNETLEQRVAERTALAEERAQQLHILAAQLTHAEQRERRRLAQMLHDHLQQLLVAAKLRIATATGKMAEPELRGPLSRVDELISQSIEVSRSLTVQLSPPILYDAGLVPALDWLARWMQETHNLHVDVVADPLAEPEAEEVRVLLFEAVRELLFNVAKHARVDRATLRMTRLPDDYSRIVITDNGVGFDPAKLAERPSTGGIGLLSVRERLTFLGGRLDVRSIVGEGTVMTLLAPLSRARTQPYDLAATTLPTSVAETSSAAPAALAAAGPSAPNGGIRVLLADDHKILRQGLVSLLQEEPDIQVVGEASDGEMAVDLAMRTRPDVIVMDVTMPKMSGIEATRRIKQRMPEVRVIGLSMHSEADMATALREAGATAYLTKGGPSEALIDAIRRM